MATQVSVALAQTLARGVYKALYRIRGFEFLFAITSRGDIYPQVILLRPGVSEKQAFRRLLLVLDRIDPPPPPPPPLRLVDAPLPSAAPKQKQLTTAQLDAIYRDNDPVRRLLWHRKLARSKGGTRG